MLAEEEEEEEPEVMKRETAAPPVAMQAPSRQLAGVQTLALKQCLRRMGAGGLLRSDEL